PKFYFGLPDLGILAGNPDGASQSKLAAAAESKAVDGANGRLPQGLEEMKNALAKEREFFSIDRGALRQLANIGPGDKRFFTRAGKDQNAHGIVAARIEQCVAQFFDGFAIQRV